MIMSVQVWESNVTFGCTGVAFHERILNENYYETWTDSAQTQSNWGGLSQTGGAKQRTSCGGTLSSDSLISGMPTVTVGPYPVS
jgi:hypothetical protein